MIGVLKREPNTPPFVIVNVPPSNSSIVSLLYLALAASSNTFFSMSAILRLSALRITGTVKPLGVDTAIERQRTALEGVAAYGPVKLQTEYMKTNFNGNLTAAKSFDVDVNTWYAEALWMITGEKYADMYKDGAFGAIKPKNNFEVGKDGMGAWEIGLRYSKFDASDFNSPLFVGAAATPANGVASAVSTTASTFKADAWTAGIKFVPNPNTRFLINYIRTSFDKPITIAGKPEDSENAITMRAQYNF